MLIIQSFYVLLRISQSHRPAPRSPCATIAQLLEFFRHVAEAADIFFYRMLDVQDWWGFSSHFLFCGSWGAHPWRTMKKLRKAISQMKGKPGDTTVSLVTVSF